MNKKKVVLVKKVMYRWIARSMFESISEEIDNTQHFLSMEKELDCDIPIKITIERLKRKKKGG